jgi:enoyl-CoA hydratase/carnithine racemase
MTLVLRNDADGVATLTLNRPEKLNALNPPAFSALRAHFDAVATDDSVRCVVLTGAGRSFCAGNDLESIAKGERHETPLFAPETVDVLANLPQPTIAKIRGHCFTGGLELALACDLLIAGSTATLSDTHGKWGLAPVWGMSVRLTERVGPSRAKQMMFTARRVDATTALAIGLVDEAVDDADLDATVDALAAEITANSAGTNRIVKRLVHDRLASTHDEALLHERTSPYGLPDDMAERMARPRK